MVLPRPAAQPTFSTAAGTFPSWAKRRGEDEESLLTGTPVRGLRLGLKPCEVGSILPLSYSQVKPRHLAGRARTQTDLQQRDTSHTGPRPLLDRLRGQRRRQARGAHGPSTVHKNGGAGLPALLGPQGSKGGQALPNC